MARTTAAAAALLLLVGLGVAGCSQGSSSALPGGDTKPSQSAAPSQPADDEDAFLKYAKCLRDNGLDVADPAASGGIEMPDGDPALVEKAQAACASQRPAGGQDVGGGAPDQAGLEVALKLAACLRSKGHDFPDPTLDSKGQLQFTPPKSGDWQADAPACLKSIGVSQ